MMKKFLIFSLLLIGAGRSFSQSLADIDKLMEKNQYVAAKTAIDKYVSDPKNAASSDGWYYKGRIYNSLSRDAATSKSDAYNLKTGAFDAFKKHQQLDKLGLRMLAEEYKSYLDLYLGLYDLGALQFNGKDFSGAYNSFLKANEIENFIISKKYVYPEMKLNSLDTSLVLNLAASALNAKDTANAVINYRRIVDAGIAGADNEQVYTYLVSYYIDKKDDANMQAMLAKAKAAYPKNNFWNEIEMDNLSRSGDKKGMFAKYEDLYTKDPNNFANSYNYSVELYNSLYGKDVKDADPVMKDKLTSVLKSAIANDKGIDATSLMTNHLFNAAADVSTAAALIKGAKPDEIKKKKELNALAIAKMDEAIPYAEKVVKYYSEMPTLTTKQKVNYQLAAGYLSDMYAAKGNAKKSADYDKIRNSVKF